jgi:hypothetical protein
MMIDTILNIVQIYFTYLCYFDKLFRKGKGIHFIADFKIDNFDNMIIARLQPLFKKLFGNATLRPFTTKTQPLIMLS